ncbi:hypothetical protein BN134_4273 [Cronobacter dublinensis 1210]|uniref:Phage protein n=1 Tax=Cronobacter dublinensis 1210 TaxID=1208656 RepID=A0ABP1WEC7_9ENTR|nr:hypothetical protein [Cronobacter dublinensis]ALB67185.1 hypothetical protein AFK67_12120 [Cronobacter dublinensis subsp. dublinensis LMG 23823]MDI7270768.1 hypothetical protein [Cronobacter dublinensis]CCJ83497.1 hypothetical protein BN134_4273 [Cronobacter dublinensis 1210]
MISTSEHQIVFYNGKSYTVRQLTADEWQLTLIGKEREKAVLGRKQMVLADLTHVVEGKDG